MKPKPDWNDAPEWAQYLTQDRDGTWIWHEDKPSYEDGEWFAESEEKKESEWMPVEGDFTYTEASSSLEGRPQ